MVELDKAMLQKEKILKSLRWLRFRENSAIRAMHRTERKLRKIRKKIVKVEREKELAKISQNISSLARS